MNKYLNDNSLKTLLNESAQELLRSYMLVVKPGMKLVCRLFWRKDCWYRRKQIREIVSEDKEPLDDPSLDEMVDSLVRSNWLKLGMYMSEIVLRLGYYLKILQQLQCFR